MDNIELENNLKHAVSSDDRLSLLQNTLGGIRAPASSGYGAACVANAAAAKIMDDATTTMTSTHRRSSGSGSGGQQLTNASVGGGGGGYKPRDSSRRHRVNRMKVESTSLPTPDELRLVRTKKRLIQQSVDLFNQSGPAKSIQFLKDNSIFSNEPNIFLQQLVRYLKETPSLDKKVNLIYFDFNFPF